MRTTYESRARNPLSQMEAPKLYRKERILLADDHEDTLMALRAALEAEGHEVQSASDGMEVLRRFAAFRPTVLILDLNMPKLDGFDVCSVIRSRSADRTLRIVALSGHVLPEDRERSRRAGFDEHLAKPLDFALLREALSGLPAARVP